MRDDLAEFGASTWPLAGFSAALQRKDLAPELVERTKDLILDGLGCAIFGARLPWSVLLRDTIVAFGASGPASVWCDERRLPADQAALLNGAYVQSFEIDDYNPDAGFHMGAAVLPAALAAADQRRGVTGDDLLAAVVAGAEVGARVGRCMGVQRTLARGWHTGSVFATFAAAAAAARTLGLDQEWTAECLGIAATQASGLMAAQYRSMVKRMHHGRAAQSGVYAAFLADAGYTGIRRVFEAPYGGFCSTFAGTEGIDYELGALTDGLGDRFSIGTIAMKPYACNGGIHSTIDALHEIAARGPLHAEDVAQVVVRTNPANAEHVGWRYEPDTLTTAQMNLGFGVAAVIALGDAFVEQYTEATIRDPRLVELARKVRVVADPALADLPAAQRQHVEVVVRRVDGTEARATVVSPRGSPGQPLSREDVSEKFDRLAAPVLGGGRASEIRDLVLGLEQVTDARELGRLLMAGT